jgi:hypothetical protein
MLPANTFTLMTALKNLKSDAKPVLISFNKLKKLLTNPNSFALTVTMLYSLGNISKMLLSINAAMIIAITVYLL